MKVSITSTLFFVVTATAAPLENFIGSCDAGSVKIGGRILTANCKNIVGQSVCSKLDLNRCIKNSYGQLQPDPTGAGPHFGDQCISCSNAQPSSGILTGGPTLLNCRCNPGTGAPQTNWPTAILDLNTVVDNVNGKLECYGIKSANC